MSTDSTTLSPASPVQRQETSWYSRVGYTSSPTTAAPAPAPAEPSPKDPSVSPRSAERVRADSPVVSSYRHDPYSAEGRMGTPPPEMTPSPMASFGHGRGDAESFAAGEQRGDTESLHTMTPPPVPHGVLMPCTYDYGYYLPANMPESFNATPVPNHLQHGEMSLEDLDTAMLEASISHGHHVGRTPPQADLGASQSQELTFHQEVVYTPVIEAPSPHSQQSQSAGGPEYPAGTLHTELWDRVTFIPYPQEEFVQPADAIPALGGASAYPGDKSAETVRCFLGQLPYGVTEMQLNWLCYTFGAKHTVVHSERIMKKQAASGERLPTGCVHAYTTRAAVARMAALMHKKLLVDDTGVWVGQTPAEADALAQYVERMKMDRSRRMPSRPYDTVVVQLATSTFIPRRVQQAAELMHSQAFTQGAESADVGPKFGSRQEAEHHCTTRLSQSTPPPEPLTEASVPHMHAPGQGNEGYKQYYNSYHPSQHHEDRSYPTGRHTPYRTNAHAHQQGNSSERTVTPPFNAYGDQTGYQNGQVASGTGYYGNPHEQQQQYIKNNGPDYSAGQQSGPTPGYVPYPEPSASYYAGGYDQAASSCPMEYGAHYQEAGKRSRACVPEKLPW